MPLRYGPRYTGVDLGVMAGLCTLIIARTGVMMAGRGKVTTANEERGDWELVVVGSKGAWDGVIRDCLERLHCMV